MDISRYYVVRTSAALKTMSCHLSLIGTMSVLITGALLMVPEDSTKLELRSEIDGLKFDKKKLFKSSRITTKM